MKKILLLFLIIFNIYLSGCFTSKAYIISFDTNGGSKINSCAIIEGEVLVRPDDPVKENYSFINWYLEKELINEYDFSTPVTGDFTLYAKFVDTNEVCKVTLIIDGIPTNKNVNKNEVLNENIPTKEGYIFLGWVYDNDITKPYQNEEITSDITLYGIFEKQKFTINFVTNCDVKKESIEVEYKGLIENCELSVEGYELIGWYLDPDFKDKYDFTLEVTSSFTLYAKLEKILKDIIYEEINGTYMVKRVPNTEILYIPQMYNQKIVSTIDINALTNCSSLKVITITESIISLPKGLFDSCRDLQYIYVSNESLINLIEDKYRIITLVDGTEEVTSLDEYILKEVPSTQINSVSDLTRYFDYAFFNRLEKFVLTINFEVNDLNTLINNASEACKIEVSHSSNFSLKARELTCTTTYKGFAVESSDTTNRYIQLASGCDFITSTRDDNYNNFKINKISKTYNVADTEQLYYILERGYKPTFITNDCKASQIYEKAQSILRKICDDSMSEVEKLHAIYDWLIMNVTYDKTLFEYVTTSSNTTSYKGFYLEGVFDDYRAVCDGISKAFVLLARIEGLEAIRVTGKSLSSNYAHAWNKVKVNNIWYVIDATGGGVILNKENEVLVHNLFMVSDVYYSILYKQSDDELIIARGDYHFYENIKYRYLLREYDYNITSQEELNIMLLYYKSNMKSNETIDFKISFDVGENIVEELTNAVNITRISIDGYYYKDNILVILGYK